MYTRGYFNRVEVLFHHFRALLKACTVFLCPPINQVAILVKLTTLVIKAVGHLMANHYTNRTIVKRVVRVHIKEWILQNTRREADFVGSRIVICVHRLWGHKPFIFIYWLAQERQ